MQRRSLQQLALIDCLSPTASPYSEAQLMHHPVQIALFYFLSKQSDSINQSNPVRGLVLL